MRTIIQNETKKIIVDGDSRTCVFTLQESIKEIQIYDNKAIIMYSDGSPNTRLAGVQELPKYAELMQAYYDAKKLDPPTKYHTWNDADKEFEITAENQAVLDADLLAIAEAQAIKDAELATNPLASITLEQAETWIDANVVDLASAKKAMKKIVKLIIVRT